MTSHQNPQVVDNDDINLEPTDDSQGTDDSSVDYDDDGNPKTEENKVEPKGPSLDDIDTEKVRQHALKEGVEPVADEIFKKISTDPKTIKMIEDWKRLGREDQRLILRADASMIGDAIKSNIPLYQFYHSWKMLSSAKQRALVYYGILPMDEADIRQIEESYGLRDKVAATGIKVLGFFIPEVKVLDPYVGGYVAGAEFNKQFARKVRERVREKLKMEEARKEIHEKALTAANNSDHFAESKAA